MHAKKFKVFSSNSGLISFKKDRLKVSETNLVLLGAYSNPKSYFCNRRKSMNILFPAGNYMFKVNNRNRSGIFIVIFEHISHLLLVFLLLTLSRLMPAGLDVIVDFLTSSLLFEECS